MKKGKKEFEQELKEEYGAEVGEDVTKYGEFVSSYFAWVPLPMQKEKAEEMQEMTKNKNNKNNKNHT